MERSKENVMDQMETQSRISRFAFVSILRGKVRSTVSDRMVKILRKSSFCSSNPLIKKLIIHNVQMYCIVIETSGTQSLKIICASVPYLLTLLSRANPKLKGLLEDEKIASYLKFFQEADMESLLTSLCTATIIIQKGINMCYPTLCITLSRDALLFTQETWKYFLKALRNGLVYVLHFIMEDLGPVLRFVCAQNLEVVKYLAKNVPVFAFAGAKGLVIFSFLVRRIIRAVLRALKSFVIDLKCAMLQRSIDFSAYQIFKQLYMTLKQIAIFLVSGCAYQYLKHIFKNVKLWCLPASKNVLSALWNASADFVKYSEPHFRKIIRYVISFVSYIFHENNRHNFLNFCCSIRPVIKSFLMKIEPYYMEAFNIVMRLGATALETVHLSSPYIRKATSYLSRALIEYIIFVIRHSLTIYNVACDFLYQIKLAYPSLRHCFVNALQKFIVAIRTLFCYTVRYIPSISLKIKSHALELLSKVSPHLYPVACEFNSILICASNEILRTSFNGTRKVVLSFWCAMKTVTPHSLSAANEFLVSSKNSVIITYPTFQKAIVSIHPVVTRSLAVVLVDGRKALLEVASVSYTASCYLGLVAKIMRYKLPIVLSAIDEVTVSTFLATNEVLTVSLKAQARVVGDLKRAGFLVGASIRYAELELTTTLHEVVQEINYIIADHPEVQYFYKSLTEEAGVISLLTDKLHYVCYSSYLGFTSNISSLRKSYDIFKEYLANSSDNNHAYSFIFNVLCKILDSFLCKKLKSLVLENSMRISSSVVYHVITFIQQNISIVCSELVESIFPKSWNYVKNTIPILWKVQLDVADELWTLLENMSIKIWSLVCDYTPHVWRAFKNMCENMWLLSCNICPRFWKYMLFVVPVLWSSNRHLIQCFWKMCLQICYKTWSIVVSFSSATCTCALHTSPKVWGKVSENSRLHWQLFCLTAENSWETATDISYSSWEVLNRVISNSWNYGFRPVTMSACCMTGSIVAKSIKFSHITYTQTGKLFLFLCVGLPGTRFPFLKTELSSKFGESSSSACVIFKKCVSFSSDNFIKPGFQRKFLYNSVKGMCSVSSRITDWCFDYLKTEKVFSNLVNVSKVPFIPVSLSYTLSQELVKKYSAIFCLKENSLSLCKLCTSYLFL